MKIAKITFWVLWRFWFYILMGFLIILMLPLLVISIIKESWYPFFFRLARFWAKGVLLGMGFHIKILDSKKLIPGKSYMLVANHTSMTDIMLMLAIIPKNPFVFVGKKELSKIPLFGFFYKRTCILVDRNNSKSKQDVFVRAQNRLNQGLSICIFPEGGVPDESVLLDEFKDGAFRLAIEHQIPIVPITFFDNKERFSFTFLSGSPGRMRVKFHPPIETQGKTLDYRKELKEIVRNIILKELNP